MKKVQLILSVGLMLCLCEMPYGYYNLIRFASCIVFGIMSLNAYKRDNNIECVGYAALGMLFQPLFKIALGREIWQVVDIIAVIVLIIPLIKKYLKK